MAANLAITEKIRSQLQASNKTIDINDPVIKDLFINFGANIVSEVDTRVGNLQNRFSVSFLDNLTDTQLDTYAYSMKGMTRYQGEASTTYIHFILSQRINGDVVIPANTVVATQDSLWQFYSTMTIVVSAGNLDAYYNAMNGSYEIRVPVQAAGAGTDYNVAGYRLTNLLTSLPFTVRVENREDVNDGKDPETSAEFKVRFQNSLVGFDASSKAGLKEKILQTFPKVSDVDIYHAAREANSYIIYYIGADPFASAIAHTISSSYDYRIDFPAEHVPIRYVDSVVLDNTLITAYTYTKSQLILDSSLNLVTNATLIVNYQYNGLNQQITNYLDNLIDIADSVWLPQEANPISLITSVKVKPASYIAIEEVQDIIVNYLTSILNNTFIETLSSLAIEEDLKITYSNIADIQILFNDSQFLTFDRGTYPVILAENITVDSF